jgi:glutathione S-transferase
MASRAIDALSQILGDNQYFLGPEPCGADATVFAFVAATLTPTFPSPIRDKMQSTANLVAYRDRMMAEFYPNFGVAVAA